MHGWTIAYGFKQSSEMICDEQLWFHNFSLNKFPKDRVDKESDEKKVFFDGYVFDKERYTTGSDDWETVLFQRICSDLPSTLKELRGGFCGFTFDKKSGEVQAFTDHVSNKSLYYYVNDSKWMVGTNIDDMVKVLKTNGCNLTFNNNAAKYMLTYGFMLDESTFVSEIRRILPGQIISILSGKVSEKIYYQLNHKEKDMSEDEAVELVDCCFREAVRREFEKDKEYGYKHLVDLSGGLDSRMTSWVAHEVGYTDQINFTYSRAGYLDEKIATEIAKHLKHEFVFKMLDDIAWMKDLEEIVSLNNGASLFLGISGGRRALELIDTNQFGIEHTGMIGDAILSTFYHDEAFSSGAPQFGYNRYSDRLKCEFDISILDRYPTQEIFAVYTRGILGAQSSYMIRQHYVETSSPFMDVDFLEAVFSLPFRYRNKHYIYLKWLKEKYPEATFFGWEKWGGINPRTDQVWKRRIKTTKRLAQNFISNISGKTNDYHMTPMDYWYSKDRSVQDYFDQFYQQVIHEAKIAELLRKDIQVMYEDGNVFEKGMALTVLAEIKRYFLD